MRSLLIVILGLTIAAAANGASQVNCPGCTVAENLRKDVLKLKYGNDDDRLKGQEKVTATVTQLLDFRKAPKNTPNLQLWFKSLLELSRDAAPFDGEGQLASVLSDMIVKDASLHALFSSFLAGQSKAPGVELCKSKLFENSVAEDVCYAENGVKGQGGSASEKIAQKCTRKFDFSECVSKK